MRSRTPLGVAAVAALTTTMAAGVAAGELPELDTADQATATGPAAVAPPPPRLQRLAAPVHRSVEAGRRAHARAERRRKAARRPVHPVAGAAGYGEAAARFGNDRGGHTHAGQDVFAPAGTPVRAVEDAVVAEAGSDGSRGNFLVLRGTRTKREYAYFHLQAPAPAKAGERVRRGERVGRVGCTGRCFGDHLHFEVRRGGDLVDPLPLLRRWARGA